MNNFTKAINILDKYGYDLYAEHDIIYICVRLSEMSARDIIDVLKLGLNFDRDDDYEDCQGFYKFV